MMRRTRLLVATSAVAAFGLTALPAGAQVEDTTATLTLTANGGLAVNVPTGTAAAPVDLGAHAADGATGVFLPYTTSSFGDVNVVDSRAALIAEWTAVATGTHFDLQGATADPIGDPNQRILNTAVTYDPGAPTVNVGDALGLGTPVPGTLDLGATVLYAGSGSNDVTWTPSLTFTLLGTQVVGTYQGTITHSVS